MLTSDQFFPGDYLQAFVKNIGGADGLYRPEFERANCGIGCVAQLNGRAAHAVIADALRVLRNLEHRGAAGGDAATGDGAGVLFQVPDAFFRHVLDFDLPPAGRYGVGMFFLPAVPDRAAVCQGAIERIAGGMGLSLLGWRAVPVQRDCLGREAQRTCPLIMQGFFALPAKIADGDGEKMFYLLRRRIDRELDGAAASDFYTASLSARTIVYKGLMLASQLPVFYPDLAEEKLVSAFAIVHQRYSTNTFPTWPLAQPFRCLAHNGEINTLRGNLRQMRAREKALADLLKEAGLEDALPVIDERGSDSACLDNAAELLALTGRELPHALMMLIPEAWGAKYPLGPDLRGFFEYHAGLMEPWDGPAAVAFSDGSCVGALLDRNGLRPTRYVVTRDQRFILASEAGTLALAPEEIVEQGSLRPGQMIVADLVQNRLVYNGEIKAHYARRQPYRRWVEENKLALHGFFDAIAPIRPDTATLPFRWKLFGYTREELRVVFDAMAARGEEPVGSMGDDTPLAVFSLQPQLLFNYFRQLFAQVTNPPLDPIREELVMSLMTFIGNHPDILHETPQQARLIKLRHPVLSNEDVQRIRMLSDPFFQAETLPMVFPAGGDGAALRAALENLADAALKARRQGKTILILSDRELPAGAAPLPALLATSAVSQALARAGLRTNSGVIVETGEARTVMHLALLLGFGATAVNPYLAFETVAQLALDGRLSQSVSVAQALDNYVHALCKGLLKIMSKMGISTLRSYRGAQVFEAIGLSGEFAERWFAGTLSRVGGIDEARVAADANARLTAALVPAAADILPSGGVFQYRADGERHLWTPLAIHQLQKAARDNDMEAYSAYSRFINEQQKNPFTLRGTWRLRQAAQPVALEEVEPAEKILQRFVTSAMSFGSLSKEAHETIAAAMNRIGAMSNSGEGGEDPARYQAVVGGDNLCSAVKQVASGRFGVTAEYLVSARELQIKIAQGAKPGEGGQLPGHKVDVEIARVRHSTPGVTLISPPPHHDIYSIEDLAQLIFDLRCVNPAARISVKLVSEAGVGTIAAGVAKAGADVILISGADGGTGAAPLSSIKHAGMPWELGLAETHQTLLRNGLRGRVRLQTDGQLRTGRDVVIAALLGADEFGFATAPLVVLGCVMMRKCHQNTCPVGIATQNPELRRRFAGKPEHLINYFTMVAEEARVWLASLGLKSLAEARGRADLLENAAGDNPQLPPMDYSAILCKMEATPSTASFVSPPAPALDEKFWPLVEAALEKQTPVRFESAICNTDRAVGARLAGNLVRRRVQLADDVVTGVFRGVAGQSFGAFIVKGMTLILEGAANDYVGKGLSGGRIIVRPAKHAAAEPPAKTPRLPPPNIVAGNTLLYGATSGYAYICGAVGERFAVRNSGACAVVEGVGNHGCEYMTGGRVVVLGPTGLNFAAGMSGGIAYVLDEQRDFDIHCNLDMVDLESLRDPADEAELLALLRAHQKFTGSPRAAAILEYWQVYRPFFIKVFPMEYRRVLGQMSAADRATPRQEVPHG